MTADDDWGYAIVERPDGSIEEVPLEAPAFTIPEDEREYLPSPRGFTLWTRKRDDDEQVTS